VVISQIADQNLTAHAIICFPIPNGQRFEQEKHSSRSVGVRVVFTANFVNYIVAAGHRMPLVAMLRIGLAVDEQHPICVAFKRELFASYRAENNETGIGGIFPSKAARSSLRFSSVVVRAFRMAASWRPPRARGDPPNADRKSGHVRSSRPLGYLYRTLGRPHAWRLLGILTLKSVI
jgi:hypothetical protein